MRLSVIAVVAANLAILFATNAAFRDWAALRFGYLDPDMVGISGLAWPMLVMVATTAVGLGFALRGERWAATVVIGLMGLVVVDHAFGAFRDGHVSGLGIAIGILMALQCATLLVGLVLAGRQAQGRAGRLSPWWGWWR